MQLDVSTLPATTEAGGKGLRKSVENVVGRGETNAP
jgi:hypothetical protein